MTHTMQTATLVRHVLPDNVTLLEVMRSRSRRQEVVEVRGRVVFLLRKVGGWSFAEIADVFDAFTDPSSARKAYERAMVDDYDYEYARNVLWGAK